MSETKRPHGGRFRDALAIVDPGACNPSGIAHSIVDACREIREHEPADTDMIRQDPAPAPSGTVPRHWCFVSEH